MISKLFALARYSWLVTVHVHELCINLDIYRDRAMDYYLCKWLGCDLLKFD